MSTAATLFHVSRKIENLALHPKLLCINVYSYVKALRSKSLNHVKFDFTRDDKAAIFRWELRMLTRAKGEIFLTPGEHLRAEIERLGFDQVAVANAVSVSRQTINNIINNRQPISRSMAGRLGRLTGRSSDYWLRSAFPSIPIGSTEPLDLESNVVPFVRETDVRTFGSAILVNHQIVRAIEDGIIAVHPFKAENVQFASIDLTLDDFIVTTDGQVDISRGGSFTLKNKQTVNVRTKEYIEFPMDYIGRVGAMTSLAKFGIIMSHGFQVDPGYKGHLQFCLFNAGGNYRLRSGEPIISLEIMPLLASPFRDETVMSRLRTPEDREDVQEHFDNEARSESCDRVIRDFLRDRVEAVLFADMVLAKIPALNIEVVQEEREPAIESAIGNALSTLAALQANPNEETEDRDRYARFFLDVAQRIYLSAADAWNALMVLGLTAVSESAPIVTLRNNRKILLQLPKLPAKITLQHFAERLDDSPIEVILKLTGNEAGRNKK